jgi:CRP/FNR family transcriptional regulator
MRVSAKLPDLTTLLPDSKTWAELGTVRTFEPGEVIVNEHVAVQSIPIITGGSLKVIQSDDEYKEIVLYYLRPGETCVMSFLAGLYNDTSKVKAIAEEHSEVVFIPISTVRKLISDHPEWLNYIFQIYHKRFEELLDVVHAIAFKKMDDRLLQFLQKRAEVGGSKKLKMTHEQLSQELGTAREVISRLLKQMEVEGLVELGRNQIILL